MLAIGFVIGTCAAVIFSLGAVVVAVAACATGARVDRELL